ncbi:MAG: penicillin-binding protein 2 [Bacteroidota bacterium]
MVENGGFGATIAGPIATLMIEKFIRKKITRTDLETRILNKSLQGQYAKLGGLSESVKAEMKKQDSILQSKMNPPKIKKDTIKSNNKVTR